MGKYLAIFSVIAFAVFAFCSFLYLVFGCHYSGEEFSPDDFSFRSFSYRYEPITGTVISGRTFTEDTRQWLPNLVQDKFIKPVNNKEKNWHLIYDNGNYFWDHSADSDARFLVDYLGLQNESGENTWTAWNSAHPKLAKVLWPIIAEMARDDMYLVLSDVFTFVLRSIDGMKASEAPVLEAMPE